MTDPDDGYELLSFRWFDPARVAKHLDTTEDLPGTPDIELRVLIDLDYPAKDQLKEALGRAVSEMYEAIDQVTGHDTATLKSGSIPIITEKGGT